VSYAAIQGSSLSDTGLVGRVLGDSEGRRMVEDLLQQQKRTARQLMSRHRHLVEALRDALIERHELIGPQILEVLERAQTAHEASADAGVRLADVHDAAAPGVVIDLTGSQPRVRRPGAAEQE